MTGTDSEPFFKETKRIKIERAKWIAILILSNFFTLLLFTPGQDLKIEEAPAPWPKDWVEVSLKADIVASGELPLSVSIIDQNMVSIFPKAYLVSRPSECSSFSGEAQAKFRIDPTKLADLSRSSELKALPYSLELTKLAPPIQRKSYEVRF
tara:strand:+ start:1079 stop:1534 length:456 start_codon:yes stop_codon:yes gene_type:complete